jgi:hypothetical protein
MAAPAKGIACRPPVGRTLSENFAVIANRKHTFAVRNGVKFRDIFLIFGCQTLFSRQTFHGEVANLPGKAQICRLIASNSPLQLGQRALGEELSNASGHEACRLGRP